MRTIEIPKFTVYHTGDDWAALYADGVIAKSRWNTIICGDAYHIDGYFHGLLGVETIYDDAFLLGGNQRSDCAETVEQIDAFIAERDAKLAKAEELEREAKRLRSEANAQRGQ